MLAIGWIDAVVFVLIQLTSVSPEDPNLEVRNTDHGDRFGLALTTDGRVGVGDGCFGWRMPPS